MKELINIAHNAVMRWAERKRQQKVNISDRAATMQVTGAQEANSPQLSAEDAIQKSDNEYYLTVFMHQIILQLRRMGKQRTQETYTATLKSFMNFRLGKDLRIDEMDSDMMLMYEASLHNKGITRNTTSFYMRILRAVYNRAVEKGLTKQHYPFKHVYTGVDKTIKRAISPAAIRRIRRLDLSDNPQTDFARDIFLFSFYTRGMSFIDMAFLKKNDLQNSTLSYRRQKTNQQLFIKWENCMQEIIDKHPSAVNSPYLLPILKHNGPKARGEYKNALSRINKHLKEVARRAGITVPLTLYVARHSWASVARSRHIPLPVISEGMGHDSEQTTRIYLTSLDNETVDNANRLILNSI